MISLKGLNIIAFSDTHGYHRSLQLPEDADIVICAGDAVEDDLKGDEYDDFIEWFGALPTKWKLFVPGNHELSFDLDQDCDGVIIGSISGNTRIADEYIPNDLDILVTHYPPYSILDENLGSPEILNFVLKAKPKWHLFGHIHATEGQQFQLGSITCQNISVFNAIS